MSKTGYASAPKQHCSTSFQRWNLRPAATDQALRLGRTSPRLSNSKSNTQTMRRASGWVLATALLAAFLSGAVAQQTQSVNAQNRFNVAGTIYNRTGTLLPLHFNLYGIPVPSNYSDPDILLTLNSTTGGTGLNIYCNPSFGAFADPSGSYPGPGYAQWWSDLSTPVNQVFISKNDPYYKSPLANSSQPFFICSVINNDANTTTNYTLVANIISANRTLVRSEQNALNSLYMRCCSNSGACGAWKNQNNGFVNANGGSVNTDFCSFPNQICSPTGNLYRLNFDNYNLTCNWPGDLLSQFTQLSTLSLSSNPGVKGNTSAVFSTVANLTSVQFIDLSGNTGITGSLDSGKTNDNLCDAAQGNLVSLVLNSLGLTGSIPDCLYSKGSSIVYLDLGSNNFTGSLANSVPVNSSLQLFHADYNKLSGKLPASLSNAKNLVDLDLTDNMLTGTIPSGIGSIQTLQSFVVKMNNLSGPIPDTFGTTLNMQVFDAKQNSLTALPAAWNNASYDAVNTSYVNIRVSMNKLKGPFPSGLIRSQTLTYLILNENNMTGPLPTNNSMFPNIRALNVSSNQLTGTIPSQFSQTGLFGATPLYMSSGSVLQQVFDLSNNRFNGTLPNFLAYSAVPSWMRMGILLQGNNFTVNCSSSSFNYITTLCPNGNQSSSTAQPTTIAIPPAASPAVSVFPSVVTSASPPSIGMTQVPSPSATKTPTTVQTQTAGSQAPESSGSSKLSGGAIAGIVIGVLAALALAIFIAFFAFRRRSGSVSGGEIGRKSSLKKGLTSLKSGNSGFERFEDEQHNVELSPAPSVQPAAPPAIAKP